MDLNPDPRHTGTDPGSYPGKLSESATLVLKMDIPLRKVTPCFKMWGVVTLLIKQYSEIPLPVLNDSQEFLQIPVRLVSAMNHEGNFNFS
jgi:hypothetical protein